MENINENEEIFQKIIFFNIKTGIENIDKNYSLPYKAKYNKKINFNFS